MSSSGARLPPLHALLALAVVAVWGTNFVVIKIALGALPPLLLAVLRFAFAVLPARIGQALAGAAALVLAGLALKLFWPRRAGTGWYFLRRSLRWGC